MIAMEAFVRITNYRHSMDPMQTTSTAADEALRRN
jgi:hypothetical protein